MTKNEIISLYKFSLKAKELFDFYFFLKYYDQKAVISRTSSLSPCFCFIRGVIDSIKFHKFAELHKMIDSLYYNIGWTTLEQKVDQITNFVRVHSHKSVIGSILYTIRHDWLNFVKNCLFSQSRLFDLFSFIVPVLCCLTN